MHNLKLTLPLLFLIWTIVVIASMAPKEHLCGSETEEEMMSEFSMTSENTLVAVSNLQGSQIKYLAIHCTANNLDVHGTYSDVNWWKRARGWSRPGYHIVVYKDGTAEICWKDFRLDGIQEKNEHVYGVKGINKHTINYAWVGGVDKNGDAVNNMTDAQFKTMNALIKATVSAVPSIKVGGHRDFIKLLNQRYKDCPSMNAAFEFCDVVDFNRLN